MINSLPPVCSHAIRTILMVWVRITLGFQPRVIRTQTINIFSYCMNKQGITNNMIYDMKWYNIWYNMIWCDKIWYDIWHDMIWYDMICHLHIRQCLLIGGPHLEPSNELRSILKLSFIVCVRPTCWLESRCGINRPLRARTGYVHFCLLETLRFFVFERTKHQPRAICAVI